MCGRSSRQRGIGYEAPQPPSVTVGLGAAVMALPVVGLAGANPADDQLLPLIRRFQEAEAELNASGPISDEESDVRTDANNKLLSATFGLALTAESALAALDLVISTKRSGQDFEDCLRALLVAVRNYLASATKPDRLQC